MPFGIQVQVPSQALEDRIVAAFVGLQGPIPMTQGTEAVLDGQGAVVTPAVAPAPVMTPKQFATKKLAQYVKDVVASYESQVATNAVFDAARAKAADDFKNV